MATHDYVLANQSGSSFRTDLNNALAAVVSNNSNATEPATKYPYMPWADTNSGYYKIRNAANNAWVSLFKLDGTLSDIPVEGTVIKSTGESGGTKFLREDGDNTCSWQSVVALTGSSNNTICTVTGANAIQGEANLTFDGNKFSLTPNKNSGNDGFEFVPADGTTASSFKILGNNNAGADGRNGGVVYIDANYYSTGSTIFKLSGRGADVLEVYGNKNVKIHDGDLIIGTAGHGIDFSAQTASSATGATTGDENLDHYEYGTWTPINPSVTVTGNEGYYIRIGRYVMASMRFRIPTNSSSNYLLIDGLPFNCQSYSGYYNNGGYVMYSGYGAAAGVLVHDNSDRTQVYTSVGNSITLTSVDNVEFRIQVHYFVA
tara:strand:- start:797 stop:1918 length:1122 start_codon:yes stop_codon:yes gene_type:complete